MLVDFASDRLLVQLWSIFAVLEKQSKVAFLVMNQATLETFKSRVNPLMTNCVIYSNESKCWTLWGAKILIDNAMKDNYVAFSNETDLAVKGDDAQLSTTEENLKEAIIAARVVQEFLWGKSNGAWGIEEWKRMLRKRVAKIDEVNRSNPHAKVELKKRVLQQAAISIALLTILDKHEDVPWDPKEEIVSNLPQYACHLDAVIENTTEKDPHNTTVAINTTKAVIDFARLFCIIREAYGSKVACKFANMFTAHGVNPPVEKLLEQAQREVGAVNRRPKKRVKPDKALTKALNVLLPGNQESS